MNGNLLVSSKIINPSMIRNILTLRYDPSQKIATKRKTWKDFMEKQHYDVEEFVEKSILRNIKNSIINLKEKRVSVALNGGIDSSLVFALLRKSLPEIKVDALSVKFADSVDESGLATKIAEQFEADHHTIYIENYLKELPKAISVIKKPFWDIHWFYVVQKAKDFSNVLVSGDGGDELFGGYTFRYEKFLSKIKSNFSPLEKVKLYLDCHQRDWVPDQNKIFGEKINFSWNNVYNILIPYFDNSLTPINQVFLADYNGKLIYNWIPLNGQIHKFFKIKPVTPILSNRLISYATHIPSRIKYNKKNNLGKIPLRNILKKHVSSKFLSSTKQGFSVNTVNLWNSHGFEFCERYLLTGRTIEDGWINSEWVTSKLSKMRDEPNVRYVNKFFGLLAFEIWYRVFITKEMNSDEKLT